MARAEGTDPRDPESPAGTGPEIPGARRASARPGERQGEAGRGERGDRDSGREQSQGGDGLYGSDIEGNIPRASLAELIGTFILVLAGIAVATAATLKQPIAGSPLDSLAVALAFGLALAAVVAAIGHVSGAHV